MRRRYFFALIAAVLFSGCTTDITVDLPEPTPQIVVEGYIEQGQAPYVLLTRNTAFFGNFDVNDIDKYLVHDAVVVVSNEFTTDTLTENCITYTSDDRTYTVCYYVSQQQLIIGEVGKSYKLQVIAEGKTITAETIIPDIVAFDSIWYEPHENEENDSLVTVLGQLPDPDTIGNYYRYFSQRNSERTYPVFSIDDRFFNGENFKFPLRRGQDPDEEIDEDTYGYFWRGDTVVIKWAAISKSHYDFWNTLEYEMSSGGPFGSATVIKSNIKGGLGIWGGYAAFYDTLYIPPQ